MTWLSTPISHGVAPTFPCNHDHKHVQCPIAHKCAHCKHVQLTAPFTFTPISTVPISHHIRIHLMCLRQVHPSHHIHHKPIRQVYPSHHVHLASVARVPLASAPIASWLPQVPPIGCSQVHALGPPSQCASNQHAQVIYKWISYSYHFIHQASHMPMDEVAHVNLLCLLDMCCTICRFLEKRGSRGLVRPPLGL